MRLSYLVFTLFCLFTVDKAAAQIPANFDFDSAEFTPFTVAKYQSFSATEKQFCSKGNYQICKNGTFWYSRDGLKIGVIGDATGYISRDSIPQYVISKSPRELAPYKFAPLKYKGIQENGRLCDSVGSTVPLEQLKPGSEFIVRSLSGTTVELRDRPESVVIAIRIIDRTEDFLTLETKVLQWDYNDLPEDIQLYHNDDEKRDQCTSTKWRW